jgi:glutathione peroxidase
MKTLIVILFTVLFSAIPEQKTIYDFTMKDIDGKDVSLSQYKGKVILVVNVASMCGNTPQYRDIETLYKKYKDKGFVVLGFPANNFMGQEPGSNKEIKDFCTKEYAITFPMFSKISVKGNEIDPLYKFLTRKSENGSVDAEVKWNFQKFLVSKEGKVITSISPKTSVNDATAMDAIDKALAQ